MLTRRVERGSVQVAADLRRDSAVRTVHRMAIGATVLALAVAACSSSGTSTAAHGGGTGSTAKPVTGGTLTYALSSDITTLDPTQSGATSSEAVKSMIFNNLTEMKPNTNTATVIPSLATSWSSKGNTWTFHLRTGVKFQDGTTFNATAVKDQFDRLLGPQKPLDSRNFTPYVKSVQVINSSTVLFNTFFPDPDLPLQLAGSGGGIESPASVAKYGVKNYGLHPVGTGPFEFVSWTPGQQVVLKAFKNYWGGRPRLNEVIMKPITSDQSRLIALQSGEIQADAYLPPEQVGSMKSNPQFVVDSWPTELQVFVGMNDTLPPFNNVKVRQAVSDAINWKAISSSIYQGTAKPVGGPVIPNAEGAADLNSDPYNPGKAKQLLAAAGFPHGFSTSIMTTNGSVPKDYEMIQAVQQYLNAVGIKASIQTVDFATYINDVHMRTGMDKPMFLDDWNDDVAAFILRDRYETTTATTGTVNMTGYSSSKVTKLINEANMNLNAASRNAELKQAQQLIAQDAPSTWGVVVSNNDAYSTNVHGLIRTNVGTVWADQDTWVG